MQLTYLHLNMQSANKLIENKAKRVTENLP